MRGLRGAALAVIWGITAVLCSYYPGPATVGWMLFLSGPATVSTLAFLTMPSSRILLWSGLVWFTILGAELLSGLARPGEEPNLVFLFVPLLAWAFAVPALVFTIVARAGALRGRSSAGVQP